MEEALKVLAKAADEWSKGNPEEPPTRDVLNEIVDVFCEHRLVKLPFGARGA